MNKLIVITLLSLLIWSCKTDVQQVSHKVRNIVDTVGFAKYNWQMDSILKRTDAKNILEKKWRVAISPHDDYAYVGDLYPKVLNGIKTKTVIMFGVAHKARNFNLENKLVFGPYDAWSAPYGNVKVSEIRNKIVELLPDSMFVIHEEMQRIEHSLEALVPFLQANNKDLEIVPILVPYMSYEKMNQIAEKFADGLSKIMTEESLTWGDDISILITTDAVHYGDEDWGGSNYAQFGTDSIGTEKARNYELEIIDNCLVGAINKDKIKKFIHYTVKEDDYKEYKWTWCGRYSVPFGLLTSLYLDQKFNSHGLEGEFIGYSNSIDHPSLKVDDLNMGKTAPANNHHWVGYAAVGYE